MSRFDHRSSGQEIMDDLSCSGEVVHQTLRELEVINRWLGGNHVTIDGLSLLLKDVPNSQPITIVDWGCGGGDMLMRVAAWGKTKKLNFQLIGIDANPNIVEFARHNCSDHPEIQFETANVFSSEFQKRKYDIVLATLFTHHFSDNELVTLLKNTSRNVRRGIVINDIHRHWFAYGSILWLTRLFSRSAMVRFDAPLSVLRAFKRGEWEDLLIKSGLRNYTIRWKWAFRWQVLIRPS